MVPQENKSMAGSLSLRPFVRKSVGNGLIPELLPLRRVLQTAMMYCTQDRAKAILPRFSSEPKKSHDPRRTQINFQAQKKRITNT